MEERGQIAGVRVEVHHLKLLCIDSERLSSCIRVQHGLHVVRVVEHEAEVVCEQHVGHQKNWSTFTLSAMLSMSFK